MQTSFYDLDNRLEQLSEHGDPLERLSQVIDFELFRPQLEQVDIKERKSRAGRKCTDRVLLFKMLLLQKLYQLSDDNLEYCVTDRLSFMRFLGLDLAGSVPDAKTVWAYKDALTARALIEPLFDQFNVALMQLGVRMDTGQIIDATFVEVPRQRNTREQNAAIKQGESPAEWTDKQRAQKDTDAQWTSKGGQRYYGYKDHINMDRKSKLITRYAVTPANVHDSQVTTDILRPVAQGGKDVHADSAYRSDEMEGILLAKGYKSHIHEQGYRNRPLSEKQKTRNHNRSKFRLRVEHVFGSIKMSMGGTAIRTIGLARAQTQVGLMNLAYNIKRVESMIRLSMLAIDRVIAPITL